MFNIGDVVRINWEDNKRTHNHLGTIKRLQEWGVYLSWNGGTGELRCLYSEIQVTASTGNVCHKCGGSNLVRAGTCLLCRDCGDTSGGCG